MVLLVEPVEYVLLAVPGAVVLAMLGLFAYGVKKRSRRGER